MAFVMRTGGHAVSSDAVRAALERINPSVPVVDFGSVAGQIARSLYRDRTMASLSICFAGLVRTRRDGRAIKFGEIRPRS